MFVPCGLPTKHRPALRQAQELGTVSSAVPTCRASSEQLGRWHLVSSQHRLFQTVIGKRNAPLELQLN